MRTSSAFGPWNVRSGFTQGVSCVYGGANSVCLRNPVHLISSVRL